MNTNKVGFMMVALLLGGASSLPAFAANGVVSNLSGTLSAQRPDGALLILSQKSEVRPGDTLATQKDSYAQINFPDGSSMTMRPNTRMRVENYQFTQDKPQEDGAFFRLIKGGLRTVTGLVGKRGNQDAYRISTATATIGIGSSGNTFYCDPNCEGVVSGGENLPPGTYHETTTDTYIMVVGARTEEINAGRSGWTTDGLSINVGPTGASPLGSVDLILRGFFSGATANLCKG